MLIKSNKGSNEIPPLQNINEDCRIVYDEIEKCELLNEYFCSVTEINDSDIPLPHFPMKTDTLLESFHIEMGEIIDVLEVLNPKKATGPDKISHRLLTKCKNEVAEPLYIIFNLSVQKSVLPSKW